MSTPAAALPLPSAARPSFERLLTQATQGAVLVLVGSLVVVIWISVFTRYVMNDPIDWGEQVAKYLMIWAAFLGASLGIRDGSHIAVNVLVERLPQAVQKVCAMLVLVLTSAFLLLCLYYGTQFAIKVSSHTDPLVGEMSMAWPYAAIPTGCALMLVQLFYVTRRGWNRRLSSGPSVLS